MNTEYSAEFYENNKWQFEGKRGVIAPDKDLIHLLECQDKQMFTDEQFTAITKVSAKMVADRLNKQMIEEKGLYLKVRKDHRCLGYTNATQEVNAAHEIIQKFEYNCWKLAQFKEQYNL